MLCGHQRCEQAPPSIPYDELLSCYMALTSCLHLQAEIPHTEADTLCLLLQILESFLKGTLLI